MHFSIVIALLGRPEVNAVFFRQCTELIDALRLTLGDEVAIDPVYVFDGPRWASLPHVEYLRARPQDGTSVVLPQETGLTAKLFNAGIGRAGGRYLAFLHPPSRPGLQVMLDLIRRAVQANENDDAIFALYDQVRLRACELPETFASSLFHGWIVNAPIQRLAMTAFSRAAVRALGGFDDADALQRYTDWDFLVRASARFEIEFVGGANEPDASSADAMRAMGPLRPWTETDAAQYLHRQLIGPSVSGMPARREKFLLDKDARGFNARRGSAPNKPAPSERPLTVLIAGGFHEYHHNLLCFLTYFRHLEGQGFGTVRTVFDHLLKYDDLLDVDLLIFSRARSDNVRSAIAWCSELGIPTIYMIDDNWFSVGKDWPEQYGAYFAPGSPPYDNFIDAIGSVDHVLAYNPVLIEDLRAHTDRIVTMRNSIDLAAFEAVDRPISQPNRFVVGYAGSARYWNEAFEALAEISRERDDIDVLLSGAILPEQLALFDPSRITNRPFLPYNRYLSDMRQSGVDVLLAPLDSSPTSRSKCPNKYFEITAIGAVGIYSSTEPYTNYVSDDKNGLFVREETQSAWKSAILRALDRPLLDRLYAAAYRDVAGTYDSRIVANEFAALVRSCAR